MHREVLTWLQSLRRQYPAVFAAGRVLECGAYDVNGTPRELFSAAEYVGLDWRAGSGVDVVGLIHEYDDGPFDTVISTEALEHDPYWRQSLARMVDLVAPGGALILTVAAPGREPHGQEWAPDGAYYENRDWDELSAIVLGRAAFAAVVQAQCPDPAGIFAAWIGKESA
ncbi:MAG: class I SAM-dependent methyltransferase [Chloroflexi bacterium]|nr:class I SAM-dependent methyltransferase [Chloroflexota bacterium]MBU1748840.1 class I SAM-dependent methyltransferase [Chloroflexota bacterium]